MRVIVVVVEQGSVVRSACGAAEDRSRLDQDQATAPETCLPMRLCPARLTQKRRKGEKTNMDTQFVTEV